MQKRPNFKPGNCHALRGEPENPICPPEVGVLSLAETLKPYGLDERSLRYPTDLKRDNCFFRKGTSYDWFSFIGGERAVSASIYLPEGTLILPLWRFPIAADFALMKSLLFSAAMVEKRQFAGCSGNLMPGQARLSWALMKMRKAFVMSVNEGCETEYEHRHRPIWPELADVLKKHGVSNYSIFLDPATRQLFAYVEIEDEATWNAIAGTDVCQRWWKHMGDAMPSNPDSSPVSTPLVEVFHLD